MAKNWDHANALGFGDSEPTECYIDEIMEQVKLGNAFYFQRSGNYLQIIRWNDAEKSSPVGNPIPLWDETEDETHYSSGHAEEYQCFWNQESPIIPDNQNSFLQYQWKCDPNLDAILIWWDHDLGDIVMDTIEKNDPNLDTAETVTDNVYFYWIT